MIPGDARAGIVADDDAVRSAVAHLTDHATDLIAEHALGVVVAAGFDAPSVYAAPVSRLVVEGRPEVCIGTHDFHTPAEGDRDRRCHL